MHNTCQLTVFTSRNFVELYFQHLFRIEYLPSYHIFFFYWYYIFNLESRLQLSPSNSDDSYSSSTIIVDGEVVDSQDFAAINCGSEIISGPARESRETVLLFQMIAVGLVPLLFLVLNHASIFSFDQHRCLCSSIFVHFTTHTMMVKTIKAHAFSSMPWIALIPANQFPLTCRLLEL